MHRGSTICNFKMSLFNNKYRIESVRFKDWDYSASAPYFITVCTKDKAHFFGEIQNDEMILNDFGRIVEYEWLQTPILRPDMNLTLDEFVIIPNHFHGIICIGENEYNKHPHTEDMPGGKSNGLMPQSKNLASIMRGFKSSVTIKIRKTDAGFRWQGRYHDHIIRNNESYEQIRRYIYNNPVNWKNDKFY